MDPAAPLISEGSSKVCFCLSDAAAAAEDTLLLNPHCMGRPDVWLTNGLVPDLYRPALTCPRVVGVGSAA